MKPAVSWHTILLAKSSVLYLWRPPGGGKGVLPSRTHTFRPRQNRRILRPPGREYQDDAFAEAACSGVGGFGKSAAARMIF